MAEVVILGAGLTGLSAAYHLERNSFSDYTLFEQHQVPGGLARSIAHDGFTFDFTAHLIHINNDYFKQFITDVLGFESLHAHQRKSFIYSHEAFTDFPFQMNLYGLPPQVISECIVGFINRPQKQRSLANFYEWVIKYFGRGMGKHFFFPYNSKILAYDLKKIDPYWNGHFVPQTNIDDLLLGALEKKPASVGYNKFFYYPKKNGIQHFANSIAHKLKNPIRLGYRVDYVDLAQKKVFFTNGHVESFGTLISTLPLNYLLKNMRESTATTFKRAANKLLCNSVLNFNLGVNVPALSDKHWIYYPEKKYAFYRLGFWHNFSDYLVRKGCSSIYGEIAHMPGTKTERQQAHLVEKGIEQTLALFKLNKTNVVAEKTLRLDHAYVICDSWRTQNLSNLLQNLKDHSLYSVGRFGAWKYTSMQDSVMDGKQTAEDVLASQGVPAFAQATAGRQDERR